MGKNYIANSVPAEMDRQSRVEKTRANYRLSGQLFDRRFPVRELWALDEISFVMIYYNSETDCDTERVLQRSSMTVFSESSGVVNV